MHPTCKQVPPRYGSFSTTTAFRPSSPARIAATYPPGPLPIIATSYFATRFLPFAGLLTARCLATNGDRIDSIAANRFFARAQAKIDRDGIYRPAWHLRYGAASPRPD